MAGPARLRARWQHIAFEPDSTALGQLVGFSPDEEIRVVAPDGSAPRRVLEITKLTARFPTFDTVAQATS